jgi:cytoskeletal protein CcmA (bactofilin family)
MKFGRSQTDVPTDLRSFLGEGTDIIGDIRFTEIMRVDARICGTIISETGSLLVMEKGHIKAEIEAGSVEIGGLVEGRITARSNVKILSTGRVYGDICTPALIIEYGAVFDGKCNMLNGEEVADGGREQISRAEKPLLKMADAV